jgi:hypothetical protein
MDADPDLATWPESDGNPRSDCHGWGAYPVLAAASLVLGVTPAAPGMAEVAFAPVATGQSRVRGRVPTPYGPVTVAISGDHAEIRSPVPLRIRGRRLLPGTHSLALPG